MFLICSASCHEVGLVEPTLDACFVSETPVVLIGDKAYDSDPLDLSLRGRGIEMVAPHKKNCKRVATQDGLRLRRYKHLFKVERFFSWIEDYRRLVVRWEYHAENYLGFVLLACMCMLIKYL
ncbi:transposase [Candidatus Poribacteria bacterium]|nr:transposase [Candidatus Poribacteria bacterium]